MIDVMFKKSNKHLYLRLDILLELICIISRRLRKILKKAGPCHPAHKMPDLKIDYRI